MERHQVVAAIASTESASHRPNDLFLIIVVDASVTAENPDQSPCLGIACPAIRRKFRHFLV